MASLVLQGSQVEVYPDHHGNDPVCQANTELLVPRAEQANKARVACISAVSLVSHVLIALKTEKPVVTLGLFSLLFSQEHFFCSLSFFFLLLNIISNKSLHIVFMTGL